MIEVGHDGGNLPAKKRVPVWSIPGALSFIHKVMDSKRKDGLRVRYMENYPTRQIWLEARWSEPLRVLYRAMKDHGLVRRK